MWTQYLALIQSYWDMRILPDYTIEEVVEAAGTAVYNFSAKSGAQVEVEPVVLDEAGKPTDTSHVCVKGFLEAIHETRGVEPKAIGIGGGTVARYLRRHGYWALVWMTCDKTVHQPNGYTRLNYIVADAGTLLVLSAQQGIAYAWLSSFQLLRERRPVSPGVGHSGWSIGETPAR